MFADFIEDRLTECSEYIRVMKRGLQLFEPEWLEKDFRHIIKYDNYNLINEFFNNTKQQFDLNEKDFIYKTVYTLAGDNRSVELLGNYIDGLSIAVTDGDSPFEKTVKVTMRDELFYNWNLAEKQINGLCYELLLYGSLTLKWINVVFEVDCINHEKNSVNVIPRIYRYYKLTKGMTIPGNDDALLFNADGSSV